MTKVKNYLSEKYDKFYENNNSKWRYICSIDKSDNIIKLCNKYPHSKILEIGAGDGSILQNLEKQNFGKEYTALDISKSAIDIIRTKKIKKLKNSSTFDGYNLPFSSDEFHLVILSHVIEHLEYPRKLIYEAIRVGRYVFVEVPCEDNLRLSKDFTENATGHINFYNPTTIRRLLQTCGLSILEALLSNPNMRVYKYSHLHNHLHLHLNNKFQIHTGNYHHLH